MGKFRLDYYPGVTGFYFPADYLPEFTPMDGGAPPVVRGAVEDWRGGCHIIVWPSAAGTVTALPNPNVSIDEGAS